MRADDPPSQMRRKGRRRHYSRSLANAVLCTHLDELVQHSGQLGAILERAWLPLGPGHDQVEEARAVGRDDVADDQVSMGALREPRQVWRNVLDWLRTGVSAGVSLITVASRGQHVGTE